MVSTVSHISWHSVRLADLSFLLRYKYDFLLSYRQMGMLGLLVILLAVTGCPAFLHAPRNCLACRSARVRRVKALVYAVNQTGAASPTPRTLTVTGESLQMVSGSVAYSCISCTRPEPVLPVRQRASTWSCACVCIGTHCIRGSGLCPPPPRRGRGGAQG